MATAGMTVIRASANDLREDIALRALGLSRIRKCRTILLDYGPNLDRFFDVQIPATKAEMETDWRHACLICVNQFMLRTLKIENVEPASFQMFEGTWVDELKEMLGYHTWINSGTGYTSETVREQHYFDACEELRTRLVDTNCKVTDDPATVIQHLQDTYFPDGTLGGAETDKLIRSKENRLPMGSRPRASAFVQAFYGNIIKVITDRSFAATKNILKAIQHGGSAPGEPDIVSGFETLLLTGFLDAMAVERCWTEEKGISRSTTL